MLENLLEKQPRLKQTKQDNKAAQKNELFFYSTKLSLLEYNVSAKQMLKIQVEKIWKKLL